ncbi:S-adenosylmethionine-dependent methyltransferase [Cladophialophora chaetospira]|uniref:tRNA wybutosine-synthesizing protein 2 n=1 Tax=Cladophialophora chaetospira TaxID=386627 RepID=A0AA38XHS7_9EURO|nr:S-adenosylmethionine-dependent methyltransferase [Cladophialophora chaetospira]
MNDGDQCQDEQPLLISTSDTATRGVVGSTATPSSNGLLISDLPKRYTAYPPLLLLPFNFTSHSARWAKFYSGLDEADKTELFRCIAEEGFRKMSISRVAINAPIAAVIGHDDEDEAEEAERCGVLSYGEQSHHNQGKEQSKQPNVLRSPSGLVPIYGDWRPPVTPDQHKPRILHPTVQDFQQAFWTSTSQHEGVTQVWAPLYTMFSRGNISEKARILGIQSRFPGLTAHELGDGEYIGEVDVVDLYVGIGYFAFCYLKRGVRRVYGWDINPWSIEGLRRGCERNGWRCEVVKIDQKGKIESEGGVRGLVARIREGDEDGREEKVIRCVAFLGDNRLAANVIEEIQDGFKKVESKAGRKRPELNIRHINLGLLPTSKAGWSDAVRMLNSMSNGKGGWAHIHENVDVRDIKDKAGSIVKEVDGLLRAVSGPRFNASCAHIEQVKTYAPGVMHCVYDIELQSNG